MIDHGRAPLDDEEPLAPGAQRFRGQAGTDFDGFWFDLVRPSNPVERAALVIEDPIIPGGLNWRAACPVMTRALVGWNLSRAVSKHVDKGDRKVWEIVHEPGPLPSAWDEDDTTHTRRWMVSGHITDEIRFLVHATLVQMCSLDTQEIRDRFETVRRYLPALNLPLSA